MEYVMEAGRDVTFCMCNEGRGIGLVKRTSAVLQQAAAGTKWRGARDGRQAGPRQHLDRGTGGGSRPHRGRQQAQHLSGHDGAGSHLGAREPSRDLASERQLEASQPKPPQVKQARDAGQHWDSRYRGIISQLDVLLELYRRQPESDLTTGLDHLLEVMNEQFGSENDSMMLVGFPQALAHTLRHQSICFEAAKVRYRFSTGRQVRLSEVASIRLLCLEHIEHYDAAFERFLVPGAEAAPC